MKGINLLILIKQMKMITKFIHNVEAAETKSKKFKKLPLYKSIKTIKTQCLN